MSMCLCSRHWILAMICLKVGQIFILNPLDVDESSYKEFINIQREQYINRVFIINHIIIIVTNDDPFHNSGCKWYMSQDGEHLPQYKAKMHVRYRFQVLIYTSL
jgi:hypothetical protein